MSNMTNIYEEEKRKENGRVSDNLHSLVRCPFCGSDAEIDVRKKPEYSKNFATVKCSNWQWGRGRGCNVCPETDHHYFDCDKNTEFYFVYKTEKEAVRYAVKAWNRRRQANDLT